MARTMTDEQEREIRRMAAISTPTASVPDRAALLRELDAERAAHEETRAEAEGWRNGQAQVQRDFDLLYADTQALKARLALAEAVCEAGFVEYMCDEPDCGSAACRALAAWRAAK